MTKWFHRIFGCDHTYFLPKNEDDKKEEVEKKIEKANEAVRQADSQLLESQRIHEEGKVVGRTARRIGYENHFTTRIRQALEGR
jgi:hypothetical protein